MQQVEHVVEKLGGPVSAGGAQGVLELLEAGSSVRELHHDLTVQHRGFHRQLSQLIRQDVVFPGPILAAARVHLHGAVLDPRKRAVSVELDLVQPLAALRGPLDQGR